MIKNILKLTVISLLTFSSLYSQTIDIKNGYQLKGAIDNIDPTKFNNSCAKYLFKFDNASQSWKAYITDGEDYGYDGETISSLNRTDGFWAMGNDTPCSIKINDKPNTILPTGTPYIVTSDKLDIVENEKDVIFLISKGSTQTLTYTLAGGADHRFFTVNSTSGFLEFKEKIDFENPQDLGANNSYEVKIEVSDGTLKSEKTLNINVIDIVNEEFGFVNEPYTYNLSSRTYGYCPITTSSVGAVSYDWTVTNNAGTIIKSATNTTGCVSYQDTTEGDFTINIIATDTNGNEITKEFIVTHSATTVTPTTSDFSFQVRSNEIKEIPLEESATADYAIAYQISVNPQNGTIIQKDDGSFWYRSNFNYIGADTFKYKATVGTHEASMYGDYIFYNEKTVTIDVVNSNHQPEITTQSLTTQEEIPLTIKLTAYDYEFDNITFSIVLDSIKNGTIEKQDASTYIYTPNKDFYGDENITYTANDGTSTSYEAQLNIKVTNINDAPTIQSGSYTMVPKPMIEEASVLYDYETMVLREVSKVYDIEDDILNFIVVSLPKNGKVKLHKQGGFVYVPNFGYSGEDSFSYKAYDGNLYSNIATVSIDIKPIDMKEKRKLLSTGAVIEDKRMDGDDSDTRRGIPKDVTRDDAGFVIDHNTGLMWMDTGDNLKDKTTLHPVMQYTDQAHIPDSIFYDIKQVTYEEAENYCSALSLGGYNDWRIPKRLEVSTLFNKDKTNVDGIDMDIGDIPRKVGSYMKGMKFKYAAPLLTQLFGPDYRTFHIDIKNKDGSRVFANGDYYGGRLGSFGVYPSASHGFMCMRGETNLEPIMFEDPTAKIVLDTTTNQMWGFDEDWTSRTSQVQGYDNVFLEKRWKVPMSGTPEQEIEYCESMTLGGFTDWKMPNMMEVKSMDSDEKYFLDSMFYNSDVNLTIDKMLASVKMNHGHVRVADIGNLRNEDKIIPFDENKYFSFDDNKTFVFNRLRPFSGSEFSKFTAQNDDGSWIIPNDTDFIVNNINYKACLPLRTGDVLKEGEIEYFTLLLNLRFFDETSKECAKAYAKSYYSYPNSYNYEIRREDQFGELEVVETYSDYSISLGNIVTHDNAYGTRCKRDATQEESTNFFEKFAESELLKKPSKDEYSFDKEKNTITNLRTKHVYPRLVDNGDDTLTDKLTGMMIPKYMYYVGGEDTTQDGNLNKYTWEEAKDYVQTLNDANYLGYNDWTLPNSLDEEFFNMAYGYTTNDDGSQTSFLTTHIIKVKDEPMHGYDSWYLREDEADENSAYVSKYSTTSTALKTTKHNIMISRADRIDANIKSVDKVIANQTLTLDATNSYLGLDINKDKIKYKWEYLKKHDSKFIDIETQSEFSLKEIVPNLTIVDSDKSIATVMMSDDVNNTIELRFKLTITIEDDDREFVDILRVDLEGSNFQSIQVIKIAENGDVLDSSATQWSCIKDPTTGLIWESKNNIVDDIGYKNKLMNYDEAIAFEGSKCGVNLRLPTAQEFYYATRNYHLVDKTGVIYSKRDYYLSDHSLDQARYWTTYYTNPLSEDDSWTSAYKSTTEQVQDDMDEPYFEGGLTNFKFIYSSAFFALSPKLTPNRVWLVGEGN